MPHRRHRWSALICGATALSAGAVAWAAGIDSGATGGVPAERERIGRGDAVVVFDVADVDADVVDKANQVAREVGAQSTTGRTGSLGTRGVLRNGVVVHGAPDGYLTPMIYAAFPAATLGSVVGPEAAAAAAPGGANLRVGLNERTAALTGARVGDLIEVVTRAGSVVLLEVSALLPDAMLGGAEVVMTSATADALGEPPDTRAVIWGFTSRTAVDAALAASGLEERANTGVARSWEPASPDSTLGMLTVKERLGEPWYQLSSDPTSTNVSMHPTWQAANLTPSRVLLSSAIPIRARCHVRIVDDLKAALDEVAAAGLGWTIDVANANTYGGCYAPRFSRDSWFLSRHALGMALDLNTVDNCQGCTPRLNCDVVRIFRKHNFAWGGNFSRPDGMHFEWVGERRDQIAYDSDYCDNVVTNTSAAKVAAPAELGSQVLMVGTESGE